MRSTLLNVGTVLSLLVGLSFASIAVPAERKVGQPKPTGVSLSLKVQKARLLDAGPKPKPGAPTAELIAVTTVKNGSSEHIVVSSYNLNFNLFDRKDGRVYVLSPLRPGPDARLLKPGESCEVPVVCTVSSTVPEVRKPYRLVVAGYDTATLKSFRFRRK